MRSPVNRHRIWQLIADAALIAAAWQLAFQLRFDSAVGIPPFYERLTNWQTTGSSSASRSASSPPLASTTAGGATPRRATCGAP